MGNYVNLMVIAPSVTRDDVERLATRAREVMRYSATVILCDLVGKRVRKESLVKARDAGLRILDLDVARDVDRLALRVLAAEHLGKDAFSSAEAALSFGEVRIDAHCWGNCERCQGAYQFAARFEQCMRCGQLLRVGWTHPKASVRDNEHEFRRALASIEVWRSESLR